MSRRRLLLPIPSEHQEQVAVMQWAALMSGALPGLELIYAIPNGGARHRAVAGKLRAEGVRPGVPDLHLPVAREGFHSLYIEMKRQRGGQVQPTQKWWHERLRAMGHRVEVCLGSDAAIAVLTGYLKR